MLHYRKQLYYACCQYLSASFIKLFSVFLLKCKMIPITETVTIITRKRVVNATPNGIARLVFYSVMSMGEDSVDGSVAGVTICAHPGSGIRSPEPFTIIQAIYNKSAIYIII